MRSEPSTIRNYGKLLLDLAQTVPDGMVAFFTSYSYMQEIVREWPEAEVERGGGSRGSLGAMGQVEIFEPGGCVRGGDGVCQRRVQVAGLLQRGDDGVAALLQLVQLGESIRHASKRALVHVPGRLFSVPRDEWHRALLVHQRDGLAHVPLSKAELARDGVEGPRAAQKGDARVPRGAAHAGSAMGRHACHTAVRGATLNSQTSGGKIFFSRRVGRLADRPQHGAQPLRVRVVNLFPAPRERVWYSVRTRGASIRP